MKESETPMNPLPEISSETLDPADWPAMRALAHQMIDDAFDHWQTLRQRPVWQPFPEDLEKAFCRPLPRQPEGAEEAYKDFMTQVMPYPMGNTHPRFWAWYMGSGTAFGAMAEFMAAVMNSNMGGGNHAAGRVENQVIDWCKEIIGFPGTASGLLVSGGSMANFIGLAVARNVKAKGDIRKEGLQGKTTRFMVYSSSEVHSCVQRALELLGMGSDSLRKIEVDDHYRIDPHKLRERIKTDRRNGLRPIAVIGTAGTVNTGSVDDLNALADLSEQEDLWFHVDGAIGSLAALSPQLRPLLTGIERADSVVLDLHKWLHIPFEAGCVLVRHKDDHYHTFTLTPEYLEHLTRGLASGDRWFSDYGLQLSRGFRALKVWLSFKEHGADKYGRLIEQNVRQAQWLAERIGREPLLELTAPIGLNIVCFRYRPAGASLEDFNALNQELLLRLHEGGIAIPSFTTLAGQYSLRAAICNHRTTQEDLEIFLSEVNRIGAELCSSATASE